MESCKSLRLRYSRPLITDLVSNRILNILDPSRFDGMKNQFTGIRDFNLFKYVPAVSIDGMMADILFCGNFFGGKSIGNQLNNLIFSGCKLLKIYLIIIPEKIGREI